MLFQGFFEIQRQKSKDIVAVNRQVQSQDVLSMKTVDKVNRNPWLLEPRG